MESRDAGSSPRSREPSECGEDPAVEVRGVECRYGRTVILRDISFCIRRGELFFVAGKNGSGKSTLLRAMVGLMRPVRGTIAYFGREFPYDDPAARRDVLKSFGVLYQNSALWSSMTLEENILLPLEMFTTLSRKERRDIVAVKLAQVGLRGYEEHLPAELSGGMRKRAALARALALDPEIVFFDEPSAGLDPVTSQELDRLILETRESLGTTMVIISHQLSSVFGIADRVIFLDSEERKVIAEGAPADLAESEDPRVREFFSAPR